MRYREQAKNALRQTAEMTSFGAQLLRRCELGHKGDTEVMFLALTFGVFIGVSPQLLLILLYDAHRKTNKKQN